MKNWLKILVIISIVASFLGCATAPVADPMDTTYKKGIDATLWVQSAAEYDALTKQVYFAASEQLPVLLEDASLSAAIEQVDQTGIPEGAAPAIILDIDETMLNNIRYQGELIKRKEKGFNSSLWDQWVEMEEATAIEGAREFFAAIPDEVKLIYIANRACDRRNGFEDLCPQLQETLNNITALGFPEPDIILLKKQQIPADYTPSADQAGVDHSVSPKIWTSDKTARRLYIAHKYRIIMLLGDDLGDFIPHVKKGEFATPKARYKTALQEYREYWGTRWFMLPNPTYGSSLRILGDDHEVEVRGF